MARGAKKKTNAKRGPRIRRKNRNSPDLGQLLYLVGKPIFLFIFYCLLSLIILTAVIGHVVRGLVENFLKRVREIKIPKPEFPEVKLPVIPKQKPLVVGALTLTPLLLFWFIVLKDLPSPKDLTERRLDVSTKIYDRNGVLLYKIFKDQNRTPILLSEIPMPVRLATIAVEDAEFYNHIGFSSRGIARSIVRNIKKGELSGGSTITQQLVKNALLSSEKTLVRKLRELILSIEVELTYTKDQILEMYLNEVSYGGTAYGIEEAAQAYFGKKTQELTLAEAALLAGLPKSPTKFSPFGANPEAAAGRQKEVLHLMAINSYITAEEEEEALKEELSFSSNKTDIKAPHFVFYVRQELVDRYGEEAVEKGGLEVVTTLDYKVQQLGEAVVKKEVASLSRFRVGNAALLVLDHVTGEILAMVGSKDYFDRAQDGQVNVVTAERSPGSSIKPVLYASALANGYSPASILEDTPITFRVPGQPPYTPKNYDGEFRGKMTLRSALAESRNIPAVKLNAILGVDKMLSLGAKMGITSWKDPSRYGLSLTLGGGEVKLIDLARVYATIANYGNRPELVSILKVTDYKGRVLETFEKEKPEPVLDPRVAFTLIDILRDNGARAPSFGRNSALVIPGHPEVAVKTGTSNDLKDNLTVGFGLKYLTAVWVGNNDGSPMSRIASGVTGAAPIWNQVMRALLQDEKAANWPVPSGLVQTRICPYTGTLSCNGCPSRVEWFLTESQPKKYCSREQIAKIIGEEKEGQILEPAASTQN